MQIRDVVNSNDNQDLDILPQRITCGSAVLPGTRPYWSNTSWKLKAQIHDPNCKSPHLFFIVSAVDIQWPDLHKHMPLPHGEPPENEQEACRVEEVDKSQLNVVNYWWRFE